jgi:hypothetical protein
VSVSASALSPVSAAIYAALNVAALTDLLPGGINQVVPPGNTRPYVYFDVEKSGDLGGFGTYPGHKDIPDLKVTLHVISDQPNVSEAQTIRAQAIALFYPPSPALVISGYTVCSDRPMSDVPELNLGDQVIANVVVHEEVAILRLIVENNT